ncbi:MAG: UbiA family prenyltransferase [Chloroflexota bacterium]
MGHPLGRLALLHPFPSALNALLVAALAWMAGATSPQVLLLAGAMLGFQASIGVLNDLVDAPIDGPDKPWKPIVAGTVRPATARLLVAAGLVVGVLLAAAISPLAALIGLLGWSCGAAYDLWLKQRGVGWIAFAPAFPLLLLFAWTGPTGTLPPGWVTLLPLAALAGPTLQLSNALVDLDADRDAGVRGPVVRLGRRQVVRVQVTMLLAILALAWLTMLSLDAGPGPIALAGTASALAVAGLVGTVRGTPRSLAWGWTVQAIAMALFAIAWIAAAAAMT